MSELSGSGIPSVSPFVGLVPNRTAGLVPTPTSARHRTETPRASQRPGQGLALGLAATMPVILVGSMAVTGLTVAGPQQTHRPKTSAAGTRLASTIDATAAATAPQSVPDGQLELASLVVPSTYTVRAGDTVSGIAARYGLSTAAVLALNGLSWKSLIFPRQVLRLTKKVVAPTTPPSTAPTSTAPASTTTAPTTSTIHYVIRSGDTVTAIAKKFAVSIASILTANHLVASSIIYTGRTLVIPGATAPASTGPTTGGTTPASTGETSTIVPLSASMEANARTIITVGKSLNVPTFGLVVALAAAMQESGIQNLSYGDRDSVGLFQQRPSAGWGTVAELETPTYAAKLFFGGPKNPNKGKTRGLLDIPGWQSMSVTQAAQAVQISAAPTAYAKWETSARAWVAQLD